MRVTGTEQITPGLFRTSSVEAERNFPGLEAHPSRGLIGRLSRARALIGH